MPLGYNMDMIRNTFIHLDGLGEKTERRLWGKGILTWEDFLEKSEIDFLSAGRKAEIDLNLSIATSHLADGDAGYFRTALKTSEHWRLYDEFGTDAVFLDIETNGLQPDSGGYPTLVGIADRQGFFKVFVQGQDLNAHNIMTALDGRKCLVTFFGSVFDIPFLLKTLPGFEIDMPHFDLCFGGKKIGLSGGLKNVEKAMGIARPSEVDGMSGYDAVLLWQRYQQGDAKALERLIQYNREDTVNLIRLADAVYSGLRSRSGIEEYGLASA